MIGRTLFLAIFACAALSFSAPSSADGKPFARIVAGTALIQDIVADLTDSGAAMSVLIPGSSCPGHNDLAAADIVFAMSADLIILHGFQRGLPPVVNMLEKADKTPLAVINLAGSWVSPPVQKQASSEIAGALIAALPQKRALVEKRLADRLERLSRAEAAARLRLSPLAGEKVAAAAMQADFLSWAGLEVIARMGGADSMTPGMMAKLAATGKAEKIAGVVDNLQSGADVGLPIAKELKIPHVVLSNFPGFSPEAPDYFALLEFNVNALTSLSGD